MRGPLDWRIPLVILLLLVIASATRWQTEDTFRRSDFPQVIHWKRDRWTNTRWVAMYDPNGYQKVPLMTGTVPRDTEREKFLVAVASLIWVGLVLLDLL